MCALLRIRVSQELIRLHDDCSWLLRFFGNRLIVTEEDGMAQTCHSLFGAGAFQVLTFEVPVWRLSTET